MTDLELAGIEIATLEWTESQEDGDFAFVLWFALGICVGAVPFVLAIGLAF